MNTKKHFLSALGALLFVALFAVPADDKVTLGFVFLKTLNAAALLVVARLFDKVTGNSAEA